MILVIDNYDSFVFNLARYLRELGCEVSVVRNDALTIEQLAELKPAAIVLSPGPCTPNEAGISLEIVRQLGATIPLLGVCLGHQTIAAAMGGEVIRAAEPMHGRTSLVVHGGKRLFEGLPNPLTATRYHSLTVPESTLPSCLRPTARSSDGILMAFEHVEWPVFGVQFHPESVLTTGGHRLLRNFLTLADLVPASPHDIEKLDRSEQRDAPTSSNDDWNSVGPLHW